MKSCTKYKCPIIRPSESYYPFLGPNNNEFLAKIQFWYFLGALKIEIFRRETSDLKEANRNSNITKLELVNKLEDSALFSFAVVDVVVSVVVVIVPLGVVTGADMTGVLPHHVADALHRTTVECQQLENSRFNLNNHTYVQIMYKTYIQNKAEHTTASDAYGWAVAMMRCSFSAKLQQRDRWMDTLIDGETAEEDEEEEEGEEEQ